MDDGPDATVARDSSSDSEAADAGSTGDHSGGLDAAAAQTCDGGDADVYCCGTLPCVGECATRCSDCPTNCASGELCCLWVTGNKVHASCVQSPGDCKAVQ